MYIIPLICDTDLVRACDARTGVKIAAPAFRIINYEEPPTVNPLNYATNTPPVKPCGEAKKPLSNWAEEPSKILT